MFKRVHHFIKNITLNSELNREKFINNNKIVNNNIIIVRKMTTFTPPSRNNNNNNKFLYIFVMVLGVCISHKFDKKMKT
jgi:hypothetical protein